MSANEFEDMMLRFEKSREFTRMRDELLAEFMQTDGPATVNASVERLISTDLESNPGLLDAIVSSGSDAAVSEGRLAALFERRVKSEVEAGLAGRPFEDFIHPRENELAREVVASVQRDEVADR